MKALTFLMPMLVALAVAGCTNMGTATRALGRGTAVTYAASFETVWAAMPEIVAATDLQLVHSDRVDGLVQARRGVTAFSWGENVAIFVRPAGEGRCSVEVVSQRVMTINLTAPNWTKPLFEQIDRRFQRI